MLNSKQLEVYKDEIDKLTTRIKADTFSSSDFIDSTLMTTNWNSKTKDYVKKYRVDLEHNVETLIKNCEKIREYTEKVLIRRLNAEKFAREALEQFDLFYYGGGINE